MKAESTVKPMSYSIERNGEYAEITLYENIEEMTWENEQGEEEKYYVYDEYRLTIPYRDNLAAGIEKYFDAWLDMAKAAENAEPEYTDIQKLEQEITDQMLENIEQGQQITDLELLILGGMENV